MSDIDTNYAKRRGRHSGNRLSKGRLDKGKKLTYVPQYFTQEYEVQQIDRIIQFFRRYGSIRKTDFKYHNDQLPDFKFVELMWGTMANMKNELNLAWEVRKWSREEIIDTVRHWVQTHGQIKRRDLTARNHLPSLDTILTRFPECESFNEFKKGCAVEVMHESWDKERCIQAGKDFVKRHGGVLKALHLKKDNGLPSICTVTRLFDTFNNYKKMLGQNITHSGSQPVSKGEVEKHLKEYFSKRNQDRYIPNKAHFFRTFNYSRTVINRIYGSVNNFFAEYGIKIGTSASYFEHKLSQDGMHNL